MSRHHSPISLRSRWIYFLSVSSIVFFAFSAEAPGQEKYANRSITIMVPFPPGGVADLTARTGAGAVETVRKYPVVGVNKTGAAASTGRSSAANNLRARDNL